MTDTSLLELQTKYPRARITQPGKLFYNRYQHRITIEVKEKEHRIKLWYFRNHLSSTYINNEIRCRVEGHGVNIFMNELTVMKDISQSAENFFHEFRITELCIDQQNRTKGTISRPKVKAMGYQYQVYFKNGHQFLFTHEKKRSLLSLFNGDREQYRVSDMFKDWLTRGSSRIWSQQYIYIKDPVMLTFFQLAHADCVDKIFEVVD
jgi:hypothetical protein